MNKGLGAGLATIALAGVGAGIGIVFGSLIHSETLGGPARGVRGLHRLSATRLSLRLLSIPFQIGSKSGIAIPSVYAILLCTNEMILLKVCAAWRLSPHSSVLRWF